MAEDFLVDFSADEVNDLLRKIQESSIFTVEEKQKLSNAINSSGVAYKALADGDGNNIPNTYQTKLSSAQLLAVNSGIDSEKVGQIATLTNSNINLIDGGAKNRLQLGFTSKAATSSNPAVTNNGNSITINGSRTSTSATIMSYDLVTDESASQDTRYTLPAGKYICKGTNSNYVRVQVFAHDGTVEGLTKLSDVKTDNEFEYTSSLKQDYPYICYRLWISGSSTFDNVTVYPMVCSKEAWDISQTFQPYRPTYQELYEMVLALQGNNSIQSNQPVSWLNSEME